MRADCAQSFTMNAGKSIERHLIALFNVDDGRTMEVDTYSLASAAYPTASSWRRSWA